MLSVSLSFQVLPEGLQKRSFRSNWYCFSILPLARGKMNWLCKGFQTVPLLFSKFIPLRFGLKWSPGTSFYNSKSKEPRCVPEKSTDFSLLFSWKFNFFRWSKFQCKYFYFSITKFNNQRVEKSADLMLTIFSNKEFDNNFFIAC